MRNRFLALWAALWLLAGPALADAPVVDLYAVKARVEAIDAAASRGTITRDQASTEVKAILADAESAVGRPVTLQELAAVQSPTPVTAELSWLQKAAGLMTFTNTLMALAAIGGIVAFLFLFGKFIMEMVVLFAAIPAIVYESTLILAGVALTGFATTLAAGTASSVAFVGTLMYGGGFVWTVSRHRTGSKHAATIVGLILTAAWAVPTVVFGSQLIGALSVAAFMSALGFSAFMVPGLIAVGFEDEAAVPRATLAAFLALGLFVGAQILGIDASMIAPFRAGALYVGGFVGYLGVLIIGSRWYGGGNYVLRQFPAVVAGIGAIYLGSVLGIPELQKMGGTLFVLYLMEKPFEIPAESATAYAFIALLVCATVYGAGMYVNANLEAFAPYLLFV